MLDISKLKNRTTLLKLKEYDGPNEYIHRLKINTLNGQVNLMPSQIQYIEDNYETKPMEINKVIEITPYFGEQLKEKWELKHTPERILVEWLLAESDKAYHIKGKLYKNQKKSELYFVPKTQVNSDLFDDGLEDIDVDFIKYKEMDHFMLGDGTVGRTAYKHQEDGIKFLLSKKKCILADDMGLGKVIADDVPVLTPDGWVPHGSLKPGDYVIGSNGEPTKVLEVHPNPLKDYYNITFTDGTVVESCDEHLWAVQTTNHKKRGDSFQVKPLKDIMNDLTWGTKGNLKWYIPMVKPVNFNEREIKIDPYTLGVILGDGSISSHSVTITSVDDEILKEVDNRLVGGHLKKTCHEITYRVNSDGNKNVLVSSLKEYGLMGSKSHNKFIPKDYKYNKVDVRIEVLQGLLDTDGYCSKNGTIQHYSVSKQLSDDVKELVQSLGGVARQSSKIGSYRLPNGELKHCKECYTLTINLPEGIKPFKLERKLSRMNGVKKYHPSRGIKSVEFSRKTYGQCITVEADDHLYVMDQYVVTHNTYQSIVAALETGAEKVLVVCPANAKINWKREICNFIDEDEVSILKTGYWNPKRFTIINYDILKNFHTLVDGRKKYEEDSIRRELVDYGFDLIILDEAHMVKNPKSQRTKIINQIAKDVERRWLLTGTPIANRPMDYFNLLQLCDCPLTSNWQYFAFRYCAAKKFKKRTKSGHYKEIWLTDGASNLEELHNRTKKYILRRMKEDHLDLPDKIITPYYLEMDDMKAYNNVFEEYIEWAKSEGRSLGAGRHMVELVVLRKFVSLKKVQHSIDIAEQAMEQGKKIIIFTSFTDSFNALMSHFGKLAVGHNGKMNDKQKQNSVDRFQNDDKVKVFVGNLVSAGTAITLTEAEVVIMNDLDFVPANHAQAEDRAYRIGVQNTVNVYYPIFEDTVDIMMYEMLQKKRHIISTIMGEEHEEMDISKEFVKEIGFIHKFL